MDKGSWNEEFIDGLIDDDEIESWEGGFMLGYSST